MGNKRQANQKKKRESQIKYRKKKTAKTNKAFNKD